MKTTTNKILYLDYIKILLTVLVILHHVCVAYSSSGGWYFIQPSKLMGALIPLTLFVSVNQSFFMGLFFFLAAYFTGASLRKKGMKNFLSDRLKRLGIPLLFYSLILSPVVNFIVYRFGKHNQVTFLEFIEGYDSWIDLGVLWFVAALLNFTLFYALLKWIKPNLTTNIQLPGNRKLLLLAVAVGLITFAVRTIFPVGWSLDPLGFQFGHFTQYIVLFCAGLIAKNNSWLEDIDYKTTVRAGLLALFMIVFLFPLMVYIKNVLHSPISHFMGGLNVISLFYSIWEQIVGFAIIIALLGTGKKYWNKPFTFLDKLSRATFATYIFHPLIVVSLTVALFEWPVEPGIKLLIVGPLSVAGSFLLAGLIIKIKVVNKII